jgi:RHS repeat-associated protein
VLSGALYSPFGAVKSWTWGNGQAYARGIDLDGRVTKYPRNASYQTLGFDNASRIISLTDSSNATLNQGFGYDVLDRLTSDTQIIGGTQPVRGYTYDFTGNRLTSIVAGLVTNYTTPTTTNRLGNTSGGQVATYSYDSMGNIQSDDSRTFVYNARGRMSSVTVSGQTTSYTINAFGQRVRKVTGAVTTIFVYDEGGRLVGEYDGSGNQIAEHIYLKGMPVAVMKFIAATHNVYQVYPDHLSTPRAVVDPSVAQPVWQWQNVDPFGGNLPNENPTGNLGVFKYNLRFPGQYYDAETRLHYNYHRDYDPTIGRYMESDPIGLDGGVNTFAYVKNSPIRFYDPLGLEGCGSGFFDPVIPNNPFGFPFKACCDTHDNCYDDCKSKLTKQQCDSALCSCLSGKCHSYSGGVKWTCEKTATQYCDKASNTDTSKKAFDESRTNCSGPTACIPGNTAG